MTDRLLVTKEVAKRAGCDPKTVRRWVKEGKLCGVKPGGATSALRFDKRDVDRFLSGKKG
ncbi:MAG: MerR family DNA-binding transcriptional regulator [Hoeflea sp.]|nr:MerR family DNA-binding transcriptional regulator [Hoeflea sp.]